MDNPQIPTDSPTCFFRSEMITEAVKDLDGRIAMIFGACIIRVHDIPFLMFSDFTKGRLPRNPLEATANSTRRVFRISMGDGSEFRISCFSFKTCVAHQCEVQGRPAEGPCLLRGWMERCLVRAEPRAFPGNQKYRRQ